MEKRGRVELGKTPSVKSGRVATKFSKGEPVAEGEAVKRSFEDISKDHSTDKKKQKETIK